MAGVVRNLIGVTAVAGGYAAARLGYFGKKDVVVTDVHGCADSVAVVNTKTAHHRYFLADHLTWQTDDFTSGGSTPERSHNSIWCPIPVDFVVQDLEGTVLRRESTPDDCWKK